MGKIRIALPENNGEGLKLIVKHGRFLVGINEGTPAKNRVTVNNAPQITKAILRIRVKKRVLIAIGIGEVNILGN